MSQVSSQVSCTLQFDTLYTSAPNLLHKTWGLKGQIGSNYLAKVFQVLIDVNVGFEISRISAKNFDPLDRDLDLLVQSFVRKQNPDLKESEIFGHSPENIFHLMTLVVTRHSNVSARFLSFDKMLTALLKSQKKILYKFKFFSFKIALAFRNEL